MEEEIFSYLNLSQDEIEKSIEKFINNNSDEEGIDLSKIYLAYTTYIKPKIYLPSYHPEGYQSFFGINCPINDDKNYNKLTIAFILKSQGDKDHIFIDVFNKTVLQSTCVNIKGLLSFLPQYRYGVTIEKYIPLKDILKIKRLGYQDLEQIYNVISNYNNENIHELTQDELSDKILSDIMKKNKKKLLKNN